MMKPVLLSVMVWGCALAVAGAEMRTWTSAADPTKTFEAEFRSLDGEVAQLVTKDGRLLPVRLEILSEADREFIKKMAASPAPLIGAGDAELEDAPLPKAIGKKLVQLERGAVRKFEAPASKYYLIYHGASFSKPCFEAAPDIGKKYTELVAKDPKVEMIYVAHDKEEEGMEEMLKEFGVPVPALRFGAWGEVEEISKHLPDRGATVPVYQVLNAQGELVLSGADVFEKLKDLE